MTDKALTYRPDIDGLRAVAVSLVVLFHAFPNLVPGGFLGVDVFFVISGYLVTQILIREASFGKIGIRAFYIRRIRRIFPALVTVLLATLLGGWFFLRATEFTQLSKHVIGGASFSSNILLWRESGYFDNISETKPLLHLWSLGVEEQFYLGLPLLIFLSTRSKSKHGMYLVLGIPMVMSFFYCIYLSGADLTAAFYSPFSRVWELLAGSLLAAFTAHQSSTRVRSVRKMSSGAIMSLAGLSLLLISVFSNAGGANPGYWALLPVVSTLILISSDRHNTVGRILSSRIFVSVGLISYPLYLWHWPLLSFARIINGRDLQTITRVFCIAIAILLAIATYKFIERPLRGPHSHRHTLSGLLIGMVICASLATVVFTSDGVKSRSIEHQKIQYSGDVEHLTFHQYIDDNFFPCTPKRIYRSALRWEGVVRCNQSKKDAPIDTVLLGDSHAEHLFIGLAENLPNHNVGYYIRGVLPVPNNPEFFPLFNEVVRSPNIKVVIIAAMWSARGVPLIETQDMIRELQSKGKKVFVTDDTPRFSFDPTLCKFKGQCSESRSIFDDAEDTYRTNLENVVKSNPELRLIKTSSYICNSKTCSMSDSRHLLFRDFDHLNINGSRLVGQRIVEDWPELKSQ